MAQEADLLIEAGFSDAKLAQEASRLMAKYKKAGADAQKAFQDAQGAVGDNQKLRAHMREIDRLSRAYDPVYVATMKYEAEVKRLDRALELTRISQAKYNAEIGRAQTELGKVSGVIDQQVKPRLQGGADGFRNLGFQVQDFAVQIGAGTSATQAFAQQFPQLASGFGPVGIALGTAAAILVPLGGALLKTAVDSETLEDRMKGLETSTDAMTGAAEAAAVPIEELRAKYGNLADEIARTSDAQAFFTAQLARNDLTAASGKASGELFGGAFQANRSAELDGMDKMQQMGLRVRKLAADLKISDDEARSLLKGLNDLGTARGPEDVVAVTDRLMGILKSSPTAVSVFASDIQALTDLGKVAADQVAALNAGVDAATQSSTKLLDTYDQTTQQMIKLADDLDKAEAARAAAANGRNAKEVAQWDRVVASIRDAIKATQDLQDAESKAADTFVTRRAQAYQQYGATRAMGPGAAQSDSMGPTRDMLKQFEGWQGVGKWDVNAYRAGYGSSTVTLADGSIQKITQGMVVNRDDAERDLDRRILGYFEEQKRVSGPAYDTFTADQKAALASIQHNYGSIPGRIQPALASGDAQAIANAIAGLAMDYTRTEKRDGSPINYNRRMKEAAAFGSTEVAGERNQGTLQALREDISERERQLKVVKEYGAQLAHNLVTGEQQAALDRARAASLQAIEAAGLDGPAKAAAIALVTAEYEKQRLEMTLREDAARRQVDLNTLMADSTMTYAQAIAALGDARAANVIVEQQEAAAMERLAERQAFQNQLQQQFKDGLVDAIVAGESFRDVLGGIADALAKAALQAALFGEGPMAAAGAGGGLGGILGDFLKGFGGARAMGGPVNANTPYLVGERGPEIIVPRSAGQVIPNNRIGGGGSTSMVIDLRGTTGDAVLDAKMRAAGQQILAQAKAQAPGWVADNNARRN